MLNLPNNPPMPNPVQVAFERTGRPPASTVLNPSIPRWPTTNPWLVRLTAIALFTASMLVVSCQGIKEDAQTKAATQEANNVQQDIGQSVASFASTTAKTKSDAQNIYSKTPPADLPKIVQYVLDIFTQMGIQEQNVQTLQQKDLQISDLAKQIASLNAQVNSDKTTISKLSSDNTKLENKVGLDFEIFGGIGFACGIALMIVGGAYLGTIAKYAGMAVGLAGAIAIAVGLFINSVQPLVPWITGAIVIILIVFVIYYTIRNWNAIFEMGSTTQALKQVASIPARAAVFGNGALPGAAHVIQSTATQAMVANMLPSLAPVASIPVQAVTPTTASPVIGVA